MYIHVNYTLVYNKFGKIPCLSRVWWYFSMNYICLLVSLSNFDFFIWSIFSLVDIIVVLASNVDVLFFFMYIGISFFEYIQTLTTFALSHIYCLCLKKYITFLWIQLTCASISRYGIPNSYHIYCVLPNHSLCFTSSQDLYSIITGNLSFVGVFLCFSS